MSNYPGQQQHQVFQAQPIAYQQYQQGGPGQYPTAQFVGQPVPDNAHQMYYGQVPQAPQSALSPQQQAYYCPQPGGYPAQPGGTQVVYVRDSRYYEERDREGEAMGLLACLACLCCCCMPGPDF
jgi:hypothetical protein